MAIELFKVQPDYATKPGAILKETISDLGMTQVEVARRLEITPKHLSEIINGKAPINVKLATKLEFIFNLPAKFWLNLETNYATNRERIKHDNDLVNQSEWISKFNYAELANKGFVPKTRKPSEKLNNLLKFFRFPNFETLKNNLENDVLLNGAYRITRKQGKIDKYALSAWIQQGTKEAERIKTNEFNRNLAKESVDEFRKLVIEDDPKIFVPKMIDIAKKFGVAVVFVPEIKGSRVSGLTRWMTPYHKAIIQLSLRYKTNDALWFTFFHELAHIILHKKEMFINGYSDADKEEEANDWAANVLIPKDNWNNFISETNNFSKTNIINFADSICIHPGIVVGRLQREKIIPYNRFNHCKIFYKWNI
ncbi:HigA family addiction module antitoxin [Companilactobacillus sp. HBUAS56257]|uniref:HigA family addiction module antitoxin n=1 Tax=Companilactobacillus sp. HBUAS56257 TaxID=3109360 RepID=UPI002FF0096A